ncbi:MAG: 3-dehydroquinate synthase [Rikenellaceae bacterium]
MYQIVEIECGENRKSQIAVGQVINDINSFLPKDVRVIVITDRNIHRLYGDLINSYEHILIGLGETIKTLQTAEQIWRELLEMGADRKTFLLGIGGGIVTDITGFIASTYMRGLRFGFVSTSLLGQVDASVGGKDGVNLDGYKNIIGCFNQPEFVLCDLDMLQTLPVREVRAGISEIVKGGVLGRSELFELFEKHSYEQIVGNNELLLEAVMGAVKLKADVVESDERESGRRKLLNLGHTIAHAVEKCSSDFLHGEAVAIGMATIADISVKEGLLNSDDAQRIKKAIENMGLPLTSGIDNHRLYKALLSDKKKETNHLDLILIKSIGEAVIVPYTLDKLEALICNQS